MENMAAERIGSAHTLPPDEAPVQDNAAATQGMFDPAMLIELDELKIDAKKKDTMIADSMRMQESTAHRVEQLIAVNKKLMEDNDDFKMNLRRLLGTLL